VKRYFLLPAFLLASGQAFAAANVFCFPGASWCDGYELGLSWIPIVVGLQLGFLYVVQGGPAVFLARFAGHDDDWADQHWGVMQVGTPIALVMAFPALAVLAVVGKWVRPIGVLEIFVVQGLYWLLLVRWQWQTHEVSAAHELGGTDGMSMPLEGAIPAQPQSSAGFIGIAAPAKPHASKIDAGVAAILPRAASEGIPLFPGAARTPAAAPAGAAAAPSRPERIYAATAPAFHAAPETQATSSRADKTIERLVKTYMWDDIGSGPPFRQARKLQPDQLIRQDDIERFGEELMEGMRAIGRHTVAVFRYGVDATTLQSLIAMHAVEGFDEYSADVMQRLTWSALLDRQRLFVDQTDIEIFGEEVLDCMYRLALFEVQATATWRTAAGEGRSVERIGLQ
jgi:hypothetical protein